VLGGSKPPFEELYREFLQRIYAYIRAQLGNQAEAEDVTSVVFIKAYEAYARYEPRAGTPGAWLFQIARNACLDHHRSTGRRERLVRTLGVQPEALADPGAMAEERLQYRALLEQVSRLPDRQREIIALRHLGLGFQEVAGVVGGSEDAVKMAYHRALRVLRSALEAGEREAPEPR
jgi:RNA polymerase sigma-70 factor (ECF subfamily)